MGLVQPRQEMALDDGSVCRSYQEVIKTAETASSAVHRSRTRDNRHKLKLGAFRLDRRRNVFTMDSQAGQQLAQRNCAVSILEKTQWFSRPEWIKP